MTTQIIPAHPGYYALNIDLDTDASTSDLERAVIVGWQVNAEGGATPVVATNRGARYWGDEDGMYNIECPDGRVYSTNAQNVSWGSAEQWARDRIDSYRFRRAELATA